MWKKLSLLLPIITLLVAASGLADRVRGPVTFVERLPLPGSAEIEKTLKPGQIGALEYPDDDTFVEGVEVEIRVPDAVRNAPGSFAVYVYGGVTPAPQQQIMGFSGSRVILQPIPAGNRLFLLLPIRQSNDIHSGPGAVAATTVADQSDFPLLISIQPIAKGIPSRVMNAEFTLQIRPIARAKGGARIVLKDATSGKPIAWAAPDSPVTVTLNGQPIAYQTDQYILDPGLYRLDVESSVYNSETRTFDIDKGKTTDVTFLMEKPSAHLRIDAPRGATVFLDGTQVTSLDDLRVPPGEHTVLYKIGDYTVSRRFNALQKKDYEISLFLDIMVNETK
ncbi:hypothetical protein [Salinispira pacifica]